MYFSDRQADILSDLFYSFNCRSYDRKTRQKLWIEIVSMILGLAVCYAFGTVWFMFQMKMGLVESLLLCVVPYLIADALKIAFSAVLVNRLDKVIKL